MSERSSRNSNSAQVHAAPLVEKESPSIHLSGPEGTATKLLVFAFTPPPHHGQSWMVRQLLH
ncbi:MAG: hypothetical protein ACO1QB_08295, partial [Verrucomicrobiales bacterium]